MYTPSNDIWDAMMNDEAIYKDVEDAVHLVEICVGGDPCEPDVEGDISSFQLRTHGRHRLQVENYFSENIVGRNMQQEYSERTNKILEMSAEDWRKTHSSPIVKKSSYKISPTVDKELAEQKGLEGKDNPFKLEIPDIELPADILDIYPFPEFPEDHVEAPQVSNVSKDESAPEDSTN